MSYKSYKNTYLQQLPFELQDYIFEFVKNQNIKELNAELLHNIDNSNTVIHLEDDTLYRKLVDYLLSINWINLHLYTTRWIEQVINNNDSSYMYLNIGHWNNEHNLCRYVSLLENSLYLLHDPETIGSSEFGIRTRLMICLAPLSYQELLSLCKFIKKYKNSIDNIHQINTGLNNTI